MKKYIPFMLQASGALLNLIPMVFILRATSETLAARVVFSAYFGLFVLSCSIGAIGELKRIRGTNENQKANGTFGPALFSTFPMVLGGPILCWASLWCDFGQSLPLAYRIIIFTCGFFMAVVGSIAFLKKWAKRDPARRYPR